MSAATEGADGGCWMSILLSWICVLLGNRLSRDTSQHLFPRPCSVRDQRQSPPSCPSAKLRLLDSQSRVTSLYQASSCLLFPMSCPPASQEGTSLSPAGKATSLWPSQVALLARALAGLTSSASVTGSRSPLAGATQGPMAKQINREHGHMASIET